MEEGTIGFPMYTVYENPSDYPGKFVVRRSFVAGAQIFVDIAPTIVCDCLAEAREAIPSFYIRIDRHPGDDPKIVEVWL